MNIILSNTDSAPIYEQITRQLRAKIVSGELAAGQALPSMRLLARELRISVITTKRAYEELEREGLIVTQTGRGSFVAQVSGARLREEHVISLAAIRCATVTMASLRARRDSLC